MQLLDYIKSSSSEDDLPSTTSESDLSSSFSSEDQEGDNNSEFVRDSSFLDKIEMYSEIEFKRHFRLTKATADNLIGRQFKKL